MKPLLTLAALLGALATPALAGEVTTPAAPQAPVAPSQAVQVVPLSATPATLPPDAASTVPVGKSGGCGSKDAVVLTN